MSSNILHLMDNSYLLTLGKLFIILYAAMVAPNLPGHITKLFHQTVFQIIMFAIITFVATKDITMSILLTIAFFISFHSYTRHLYNEVNKTKQYLNQVLGKQTPSA
jgi:hypothetical protein